MPKLGDYNLPIAICRLYLKGDHWLPLGLNTEVTAKHRSSPTGPVVTVEVLAVVEGERIVAWGKLGFSVQEIGEDGKVEPLDLTSAAEALSDFVTEAQLVKSTNVVSIISELRQRRRERGAWKPSEELKKKALERAELQIRDKVLGGRAVGVMITDSHVRRQG